MIVPNQHRRVESQSIPVTSQTFPSLLMALDLRVSLAYKLHYLRLRGHCRSLCVVMVIWKAFNPRSVRAPPG